MPGGLVQRVQMRQGRSAQPVVVRGQSAELQHPHPEPVVPALPVQPAQTYELIEYAVHRRARKSRAVDHFGQRQPGRRALEGTQYQRGFLQQ